MPARRNSQKAFTENIFLRKDADAVTRDAIAVTTDAIAILKEGVIKKVAATTNNIPS